MTKTYLTLFIYLIFWSGALSPFVSTRPIAPPPLFESNDNQAAKHTKKVSDPGVIDVQSDIDNSVLQLLKVPEVEDAFNIAIKNRLKDGSAVKLFDQDVFQKVQKFDPAVVKKFRQIFSVIRNAQLSVNRKIENHVLEPLKNYPGLNAPLEARLQFAYYLQARSTTDKSQHLVKRSQAETICMIVSVICGVVAFAIGVAAFSPRVPVNGFVQFLSGVLANLAVSFGSYPRIGHLSTLVGLFCSLPYMLIVGSIHRAATSNQARVAEQNRLNSQLPVSQSDIQLPGRVQEDFTRIISAQVAERQSISLNQPDDTVEVGVQVEQVAER